MARGAPAVTLLSPSEAQASRLCRFCRRPVRGRALWHSGCLEEWGIACGETRAVRTAVFRRDAGVCARCGVDTVLLGRVLSRLAQWLAAWTLEALGWSSRQAAHALLVGRLPHSLWQADHAVALAEGGLNRLCNYRTLDVLCHSRETARLVRGAQRV